MSVFKIPHQVRIWDKKAKDFRAITVEVEVNTFDIAAQYAARAHSNKGKQVRQCHGAVVVRVVQ